MIGSEVEIYNLALNAVGGRNNIVSPTESSREAEVCQLWYSSVRDQVLAAAPWPEATKVARLGLVSQADDEWTVNEPRPGYAFAYELPSDCIRPQYLSRFERFQITASSNSTRLLNTNVEQALLVYTCRQEIIPVWSSELQMAIVYGLAANICMPLTGKAQRANMLVQRANSIVLSARESAANTSDDRYEHIPEWLAGRGFSAASATAYYHPFGSLLTVVSNVN